MSESHAAGIQTATLVDLSDATGTSSQLPGPAAEVNRQATVPSSSAGKPGDEEFDMFAQSRQSFQENLPRAKCVICCCF